MIISSPVHISAMTYSAYTDKALLQLLQDDNEMAFTVLFERYRNKLFYYLRKHTKSNEIAEEIVTDIFIKLWEGRKLADQITDLGAFIHKVGYYKAMDFLRTTARHAVLQQAYIDRMENGTVKTADELLMDTEAQTLLYKAINQLPGQRRKIYRLSREMGLTHKQIADALHLSPSTVNNAMTAATRSIARFLQHHVSGKAAFSIFFLFA